MSNPAAGIADTRGHYRRQRSLYADDLTHFLSRSPESILGLLAGATGFPVTLEQRFAWTEQIELLRDALSGLEVRGRIYFEYAIPRLGKWIDVLLVLDHVVFVIEFNRQLALNCRMDNNRRPYERICTARFPDHSCGAVVRCLSLASARRVADAP